MPREDASRPPPEASPGISSRAWPPHPFSSPPSSPSLAQPAPPKKTVFVITDAEGVAGVCRQEQVEPTNPELQKLLTGEVNAAVRGFLSAGADEVIVWDGHDGSRTLSAATLEPRARLVIGSLGPTMMLERGFAAVAFVGQHARANRAPAVMAHSYSSLGIQRILMNGREVGEIETRAALAGWFGVPVVFLSGDQAAADDLRAVVPEAETAVVKEGLGYYSCLSLTAEKAQELIERKAALALAKVGQVRPVPGRRTGLDRGGVHDPQHALPRGAAPRGRRADRPPHPAVRRKGLPGRVEALEPAVTRPQVLRGGAPASPHLSLVRSTS